MKLRKPDGAGFMGLGSGGEIKKGPLPWAGRTRSASQVREANFTVVFKDVARLYKVSDAEKRPGV